MIAVRDTPAPSTATRRHAVGRHRFTQLDVFTDRALAGNPLAVVHDAQGFDEARMAAFARAYLEIIAVEPDATPPTRPRWFGPDAPAVRARLAVAPQLLHRVARTDHLDADLEASRALGVDPGPAVAAQRETPRGVVVLERGS